MAESRPNRVTFSTWDNANRFIGHYHTEAVIDDEPSCYQRVRDAVKRAGAGPTIETASGQCVAAQRRRMKREGA